MITLARKVLVVPSTHERVSGLYGRHGRTRRPDPGPDAQSGGGQQCLSASAQLARVCLQSGKLVLLDEGQRGEGGALSDATAVADALPPPPPPPYTGVLSLSRLRTLERDPKEGRCEAHATTRVQCVRFVASCARIRRSAAGGDGGQGGPVDAVFARRVIVTTWKVNRRRRRYHRRCRCRPHQ